MMRVLHVLSELGYGGVEAMLYNYYCYMNREDIKFDFLVHGKNIGGLEARFLALGSNIYHVTPKRESILKNFFETRKIFLRMPQYDIVHCHQGGRALLAVLLAKCTRIPKIIVHCHGIKKNSDFFSRICLQFSMQLTLLLCNEYFACSDESARYNFGSKYVSIKKNVIPNAIDVSRFVFDKCLRTDVRSRLGLSDFFVMGQIGRFSPEKNHKFTLEIAVRLSQMGYPYKLLLIGEGPSALGIKKKIDALNLSENVIFTGGTSDVSNLMQAIDLMLLPSIHEGLGIVAIEAQAAGLKCLVSDNVPLEVALTEDVTFINLEDKHMWVQKIIEAMKGYERRNYSEIIRIAGYDVRVEAKRLEAIYNWRDVQ